MSKNTPIDEEQPVIEDTDAEENAELSSDIEHSAKKTAKGKRTTQVKSGFQTLRQGFRDAHKGPKIGNAPRGTRRTMGKR